MNILEMNLINTKLHYQNSIGIRFEDIIKNRLEKEYNNSLRLIVSIKCKSQIRTPLG